MNTYTENQWRITVWVVDAIAIVGVAFLAWLTWADYRQSGRIGFSVGVYALLNFICLVLIRGVAVRERKRASKAAAKRNDA
jgi:hypothetical protein